MTKRTDGPSSAVKLRAMKRDRFQCTYCGAPGTDAELEVDHIIPVARGGSHHISNLTTACRTCNQKKGAGEPPPKCKTRAERSAAPEPPRLGVSITEVMICWTAKTDTFAEKESIALVPWPDERRRGDRYVSTTGACDMRVHDMPKLGRQHFVLSTALGIILDDGLDPAAVHAALWPLIEYRDALPPDAKAPPTNHRYGDVACPAYFEATL